MCNSTKYDIQVKSSEDFFVTWHSLEKNIRCNHVQVYFGYAKKDLMKSADKQNVIKFSFSDFQNLKNTLKGRICRQSFYTCI